MNSQDKTNDKQRKNYSNPADEIKKMMRNIQAPCYMETNSGNFCCLLVDDTVVYIHKETRKHYPAEFEANHGKPLVKNVEWLFMLRNARATLRVLTGEMLAQATAAVEERKAFLNLEKAKRQELRNKSKGDVYEKKVDRLKQVLNTQPVKQ